MYDHYGPASLNRRSHKNNVIKSYRTYPITRHGGLSEHLALELEKNLIKLYKAQLTNATSGGEGLSGYKHSKKAKAKISACRKGNVPANKGKARSAEVKAAISKANSGENNYQFIPRDFIYYHFWAQAISNLTAVDYCKSQKFSVQSFNKWKFKNKRGLL
jgi:hypothetical protein